jgi:hypothetical protein
MRLSLFCSLSDGWRLSMRSLVVGLILAAAMAPVSADIMPSRPRDPSAPSGPDRADIRGVQVQQAHGPDRRWMTTIYGCAWGQPVCKETNLLNGPVQCSIVRLDGHSVSGGDIAGLLTLEKAAGGAPIKLTLENCIVPEIELGP